MEGRTDGSKDRWKEEQIEGKYRLKEGQIKGRTDGRKDRLKESPD